MVRGKSLSHGCHFASIWQRWQVLVMFSFVRITWLRFKSFVDFTWIQADLLYHYLKNIYSILPLKSHYLIRQPSKCLLISPLFASLANFNPQTAQKIFFLFLHGWFFTPFPKRTQNTRLFLSLVLNNASELVRFKEFFPCRLSFERGSES